MADTSSHENSYRELIVNSAGKTETTLSQVEQWSTLSNVICYVQYNKHPENFHTMSLRPINKTKGKVKSKKEKRERPISEVDFINTSDRLKEDYLDRYEGVKSEILSTTRLNENSDLSMSYLGKTSIIKDKISTEEKFLISEKGYTTGKPLDGTKCQILLDTRASNHLCLNHTICIANHFIHYLNLLQRFRGSK